MYQERNGFLLSDRDYPYESVFREFLQNADDAGAKIFRVTVDERSMSQQCESLITKEMAVWQGPAIWIYNDGMFNNHDFDSLLNIHEGGKRDDSTKIGKFGIGFNSCFHFTDVPSFVSGKYISFLDPHEQFLPKQRGIQINFLDEEFRNLFSDQLAPYVGIEGCRFDQEYKGTLFRLPLRVCRSEICDEIFNTSDILGFLEKLKLNAISELIFFRNIQSFEVKKLAKVSQPDQTALLWKINIPNMTEEIQEKRQHTNEGFTSFCLNIEFQDGINTISKLWQVCIGGVSVESIALTKFAKCHRMLLRGGVAASLPLHPTERAVNGRLYCYLPLPQVTRLPVHLNGDWAISSDRSTVLLDDDSLVEMDKSKLSWNKHLLLEVLPMLYANLLVDVVEYLINNNINHKQILKYLWPLPLNREKAAIYVIEFGEKVLKNLPMDKPLFRSANGNGSYVSLQEAFFDSDEFIINILSEYSDVKSVHLSSEMLDDLKNVDVKWAPIPAKMVRENLRNIDLSNKFSYEQLITLLLFILEDNNYEDLHNINLIPLADKSWGKFDRRSRQKYIATFEECNLVPNADLSNFVDEICSDDDKLKKFFENIEFQQKTNVRKFNAVSLGNLLKYEIPFGQQITNWDPESTYIPNKIWLNKIWKFILESNASLEAFFQYPLLEVIRPTKELTFLDSRQPLIELPKDDTHYEELIKILEALGIRFTDRPWDEKLNDYIHKWTPDEILKSIHNAEQNGKTFGFLNNKVKAKALRNFIIENWNNFSLNDGTIVKTEFKDILRKLPIWPTLCGQQFASPINGFLPPDGIVMNSKNHPNKLFLNAKKERHKKTLKALDTSYIDLINYLQNHYVLPRENHENHLKFIISVLKSKELDQAEYWIINKAIFPNKKTKKLKNARDLYDYRIPLFQITFEGSDLFLHDDIQNDDYCLDILKRMGFKYEVNQRTFLECARAIVKYTHDRKPPENLLYRSTIIVKYLYDNVDGLGFSDVEWNGELRILGFIPAEMYIESPYSTNAKIPKKFESFNTLCLPRAIFHNDVVPSPTSSIFKKFKNFGKPSAHIVLEHLREVASELIKSDQWMFEELLLKKIVDDIYIILNEECEECTLTESDFYEGETIFLNMYPNENIFDELNWVSADKLVIGASRLDQNFVKPTLVKYGKLLKVAGADKIIRPNIYDYIQVKKNNEDMNVKTLNLIKSLQQLLDEHNSLNDVIFIVGQDFSDDLQEKWNNFKAEYGEICANRYVLAAASNHFKIAFSSNYRDGDPYKIARIPACAINPESFVVLLRYLYSMPLDMAITKNNSDSNTFKIINCRTEDYYNDYYDNQDENIFKEKERQSNILIDLLKASDYYEIGDLKKDAIEKIISDGYVERSNVDDIFDHANTHNAELLIKYCNEFIELNSSLM
ncbi:4072_t:CDS:2 [Cetraspora pellucida]|uniref:4072_t:CDS:1 n=1 Tax=Cetraspora pellucida TaxID=1433469 RepID=A0A9N9GL82_9GLOM|nr:4072_t:CDS:2 [Cetraspora pellucida]